MQSLRAIVLCRFKGARSRYFTEVILLDFVNYEL